MGYNLILYKMWMLGEKSLNKVSNKCLTKSSKSFF